MTETYAQADDWFIADVLTSFPISSEPVLTEERINCNLGKVVEKEKVVVEDSMAQGQVRKRRISEVAEAVQSSVSDSVSKGQKRKWKADEATQAEEVVSKIPLPNEQKGKMGLGEISRENKISPSDNVSTEKRRKWEPEEKNKGEHCECNESYVRQEREKARDTAQQRRILPVPCILRLVGRRESER